MIDKIALVQRYNNPDGQHEKACQCLAISGEKAGFDIIGIHKDHFKKEWLEDADIIIITDISSLYHIQRNDLLTVINNKIYVTVIMNLSDIENEVNREIYIKSKKNYFCSPAIYKKGLELQINGSLTYLAGKIDDSWAGLKNNNAEHTYQKSIIDFWRGIDAMMIKKIYNDRR